MSLNQTLEDLTTWLDIPDSYFERASSRYKAIGTWLARPGSTVSQYDPDVFPQGSFSLGTVTKPATDEDDYDIDLVCKIHAKKCTLTQKRLKDLVGYELGLYVEARGMISPTEERRRCWRLDYADRDVHFHLDVLPAVPDDAQPGDETIAITDNQLPNYARVSTSWPCCNPVGYVEWFRGCMEQRFQSMRKAFAEALKANVEEVPAYKIKTPLQRSIQILKRHRDITYEGEPDDKPISILITTLAALSYENEEDTSVALQSIALRMREFIEDRDGVLWVPNPVNPDENFADKWQEYPKRRKAFFSWLDRMEMDIASLFGTRDAKSLEETMRSSLGDKAANILTKSLDSGNVPIELIGASAMSPRSLNNFAVGHRQAPSWSMKLDNDVRIVAEALRDGFRPRAICSGDVVAKNFSLRFTALTNAQKPYDVYWQVVNTGQEAKSADSLRGGFYSSKIRKGRQTRKESTLYRGMHWTECFIVQNGVCVARSGEFVINIP